MTWTEIIGAGVWFLGMTFSALTVVIPEIRPYWRGSTTRLGPISCFGMALFFWLPPLAALTIRNELFWKPFGFLIFCCVLAVVFTIGYFMDISS